MGNSQPTFIFERLGGDSGDLVVNNLRDRWLQFISGNDVFEPGKRCPMRYVDLAPREVAQLTGELLRWLAARPGVDAVLLDAARDYLAFLVASRKLNM